MKRQIIIGSFMLGLVLVISSPAQQPEQKVMSFLAVLDLKCGEGVKASLSGPLTNVIIEELVKIGKYTVIDRANRDKILAEQGFQQTGCTDEACVVEMGRMLGVGKIVTGSIDMVGQTYLINLQLINVQTGAVEVATSETCKCEPDGLIQSVRNAANKLMGKTPTAAQPAPAPSQPPPASELPSGSIRIPSTPFCIVPPANWQALRPVPPGVMQFRPVTTAPRGSTGAIIAAPSQTASDVAALLVVVNTTQETDINAGLPQIWNNMQSKFKSPKLINQQVVTINGLAFGLLEFEEPKYHHLLATTIHEGMAYAFSGVTAKRWVDTYNPAIWGAIQTVRLCDLPAAPIPESGSRPVRPK